MLVKYFGKHKVAASILIGLLIVKPLISSWCGFKAAVLFDAAYAGDLKTVLTLFAVLFTVWIVNSLFQYWYRLLRAYMVTRARADLKRDVFSLLLKVNLSSFSRKEPGDYIATFTNDITMLDTRYFDAAIELVEYIVTIFIIGGSFFALDLTLALIIMIGGFLCGLVPLVLTRYTVTANKKFIKRFEGFTQSIKEFFGAFLTFKNYSVEPQIKEKFDCINDDTEKTKFEAEFALEFANNLGGTLSWFVRFAVVGLGLIKVVQGDLTMGLVYTAYNFANELASPLQGIIHKVNAIRSVKAISEKFTDFSRYAAAEQKDNVQLPQNVKTVAFQNVSFSIGDKKIIEDFSFDFEKGKKYLVIGKNGSGKSTLFKLLKRVSDDYSGKITVDGKDVREFPYRVLSYITSYLNEKIDILSASVRDNIVLYRDVPEHVLEGALQKAHVNVPLGKVLKDSGSNISSGEKRRIEIARSLVNRPPILVFDEVISTLDIETAHEIEQLALSLDGQTVVFISHNFSGKTVRQYDEILLVDQGRIVAHGHHDVLIKDSPLYKKLFEIRNGT